METRNLCTSCGACCAAYRVAFPSAESDETGGNVPKTHIVKLDAKRHAMKGTEGRKKRCVALIGMVGFNVNCSIYDNRPSCCRSFQAGWEGNNANPICNRARVTFGLQPFSSF